MIEKKIKMKMNYDDMLFCLIAINMFDYVFIFRYLLILDTSPEKKIFASLSFIVIQIQNVFNVTIFFEVYQYLAKKYQKMINNTIPLKFLLLIIACFFYYFILNFLVEVCVLTGINAIIKLMISLSKKDNAKAKDQLKRNIQINGY